MTMAENQLAHRNDRARTEARTPDWSSLLARAIDDMTRIVHSEFRLLSASMKTVLDEEIDRVLAFVATGVLMMAGALCLLAAVIMFLHEFLRLPWWQSFGITALALFATAIATRAIMARRPLPPATT
jgi:hypothetical protein